MKGIPILFLFQLTLTVICETNNLEWFWKTNFVSRALPWFLLGYVVHVFEREAVEIADIVLMISVAAGCMTALIPIVYDTAVNFSCVGVLLYSVSLFLIGVKYPKKAINKTIAFIGDNLSLNIYLSCCVWGD